MQRSKVVIVDESLQVCEDLQGRLGGDLFDISFCNKKEHLAQLEEVGAHFLIMDYGFLGNDTLNWWEKVKIESPFQETKLLLQSSFPYGKKQIKEILNAGIEHYFVKPFEFDLFIHPLKDWVKEERRKEAFPQFGGSGDKRKHHRFQVPFEAEVEFNGGRIGARVWDISRKGLKISLPIRHQLGDILRIYFKPPVDLVVNSSQKYCNEVVGLARTVWTNRSQDTGHYLSGLEMVSATY